MKDLSAVKGTLTNRVELLISQMEEMEFSDLKESLLKILREKETVASEEARNKWIRAIERKNSKQQLMQMVANLYLAGCDLKTIK